MSSRKEWLLNAATVVVTICAVAVAGLRLHEWFNREKSSTPTTTVTEWKDFAQYGHRDGPREARVVVVEFSDFQCPICRRSSYYIDSLRLRYPGDVATLFRHLPFKEHSNSAAVAAECAARQGAFPAMRRALFDRAEEIGRVPWTTFAKEAKVADTVVFRSCMNEASVQAAIERDSLAGRQLGTTGTPTFLINETQVSGFFGAAEMDKLVENALRRTK